MSERTPAHDGMPRSLHPEGWARPVGHAHGVIATGRLVVTAGQVGWDPTTATFTSDDVTTQTAQALRNVMAVLRTGGAGPEHLVRLTWYFVDRDEYMGARRAIGVAYREIIGRHYPAMAVVMVSALVEQRARVEIEATAVVPG